MGRIPKLLVRMEPSRLCPEQRRDAAATLGASHWVCLRSCSATNNFGMRPTEC